MKIVIAHFSSSWVDTSGGVEKVVCELSNAMVERGHEVTILYVEHREGAPYFPLNEKVKTTNLLYEAGQQVVMEKLPLSLRIYREVSRLFSQKRARAINAQYKGRLYGDRIRKWFASHNADVVISVSPMSAKYLMIDGGCTVPMIEMIHEDPQKGFPTLSESETRALHAAKAIQVLLPEDLKAVNQYFPNVQGVVIGNTIGYVDKLANPGKNKEKYKIINVGTVCSRKNQKLLVDAFSTLATKYPEWDVELWGWHGAYYGRSLQKYIEKKHLEDRIRLKGVTKNIAEIYEQSDIFAYPSRNEGFPLGVLEAMSAGLPVIGLQHCHGTNYLIKPGETGFLVEDSVESFQKALQELMEHAELRKKMGTNGMRRAAQFAPERVWDKWEQLLLQIYKEHAG